MSIITNKLTNNYSIVSPNQSSQILSPFFDVDLFLIKRYRQITATPRQVVNVSNMSFSSTSYSVTMPRVWCVSYLRSTFTV